MSATQPSGVPIAFEVTYDRDDLFVGMKVFELGLTPSLAGQSLMTHVYGNTYVANFTLAAGKSYLIHKAVYTAGDLSSIVDDYGVSSETVTAYDPDNSTTLTSQDLVDIAEKVWQQATSGNTPPASFGRLLLDAYNAAAAASGGGVSGVEFQGAIIGVVEEDEQ